MSEVEETDYGFTWGPVKVQRYVKFPRPNGYAYVVNVNGIDIYVSPKGRTVRAIKEGRELK